MELILGIIAVLIPIAIIVFISWSEGALWHYVAFIIFTIALIAVIQIYKIDYIYIVVAGASFAMGVLVGSNRKR